MANPLAKAVASAAALDEEIAAVCALSDAQATRLKNAALIYSQQTGRPILEILGETEAEIAGGRRFEDTKLGYAISTEKPPTNADRIRAMSDKELADELLYIHCQGFLEAYQDEDEFGDFTEKDWLQWLQSPAEGGDHDAN